MTKASLSAKPSLSAASPLSLADKLAAIGLAETRWVNMLAGVERFERWMEDQVLFGFANIEADPFASLEPLAARLIDDQLGGVAGAMRGWIGRVGVQTDWVERLGEEFGYWHLLNRMLQQHERLDRQQFAGIVFAFGYRFQVAKLDALGLRHADRWTCIGVETGNEEALFYRRTHWRGTSSAAFGIQHTYNYGSPLPSSTLTVGEWSETSMHVYPDGLPGRLVLPEGVTIHTGGTVPHHLPSWGEQRLWQATCLRQQPWRRSFPIGVGPVRIELSRTTFGEHVVHLIDSEGQRVALPLAATAHATDTRQAALLQLIACVGSEPFVLFGESSEGQIKVMSYWMVGGTGGVL